MTTKHEIEIPDLPEGWRAVAYRAARRGIDHVLRNGQVTVYRGFSDAVDLLIVEKIKPLRIVLEETEERANCGTEQLKFAKGTTVTVNSHKIWRVVEGNQ